MSISSVAASNPALLALSQLNSGAASPPSAFAQPAAGSPAATSNSVKGSGSASVSDEIMNLLIHMRQHVSAGGGGSSASAATSSTSASTLSSPLDQLMSSLDASLTASASTSTMATPLQQLFSSMDSNDDGGDESEFPGAVNGATGAGAAGGFLGLHSGGSGRLTTAGLTQAWENLQNSQPPASPSLLGAFANANNATTPSSITA